MNVPIVHFNDCADGGPPSVSGKDEPIACLDFNNVRHAQKRWAAKPIRERLRVIGALRRAIAKNSASLVRAMNPRDEAHAAEMLASQIIPLADACDFLECAAEKILRRRTVSGRKPLWLMRACAELHREPHGMVLVIGPSNYPLFLPAVAIVQALAAGNAVAIKPAPQCSAVLKTFLALLYDVGLDRGLTMLLGEDTGGVHAALAAGVDKVVFTGSARNGREILRACADKMIPATVELSGCDAMFVRADADVKLAARALSFGLRLNRGATCIAPRRVFVHQSRAADFETECLSVLTREKQWQLCDSDSARLAPLIIDAAAQFARLICGEVDHHGHVTAPIVVADAKPAMRLLREDHFGAATAIVSVARDEEALACNDQCPYALGASVFSANEAEANAVARRINAGVVTINDVIAPTADPRLPFGGRKHSGFGVTRGAEGLLEMTVPKVVIKRRGNWRPHLDDPHEGDVEFFSKFLSFSHGATWGQRIQAAVALFHAAKTRRQNEKHT
jgi:acyl-CoA reductase-like NAD-dependent aldehyde dehydrogenase